MVEQEDVFVGVSYAAKLQYEELKKTLDRAADSFNRFKIDGEKHEKLLSTLSGDLEKIHESFEKIFSDLDSSSAK